MLNFDVIVILHIVWLVYVVFIIIKVYIKDINGI